MPDAAAGTTRGAFALSEPGAGSNPADMTTIATPEADHYRLRGTKHFISNAGEADCIVVFAKTDTTLGTRGTSAFVMDPKQHGVNIAAPEKTMGLPGSHVFEIAFDCTVPAMNRLGAEGSGFRIALKALDADVVRIETRPSSTQGGMASGSPAQTAIAHGNRIGTVKLRVQLPEGAFDGKLD